MLTLKFSHRFLILLLPYFVISITQMAGCSSFQARNVPSDFSLMMDVRTAEKGSAQNINIQIDAYGRGKYEYYDTGGVIHYDTNKIVTHKKEQVLKKGTFKLSRSELGQLWEAINTNHFFDLDDDYRMEIGHSYAFILISADGNQNMVDNIGMEVREVRSLVETVQSLLPKGVEISYGEGYIPEN